MSMTKEEIRIRQSIIDTCKKMNESGLNQGTSGNISVRHKDGMLITCSGMDYFKMKPGNIVWMSLKDDKAVGENTPSTEWRFHSDILKTRKEFDVVIHNHSLYATSMSVLGMEIPAHHYMIAVSGGNSIRCAEYATFGTEELKQNIQKAMKGRNCCILANHGTIAAGKDLDQTFALSFEIENLAKQYILASSIGKPKILSKKEMDSVIEKFKTYGQPGKISAKTKKT